jgi:pilus assembly protein CpaF
MNTGHDGSMTTVHANNARDAVRRVENMVSMAGLNFPVHAIRQQMASAVNLMVHVARLTGGRRKVVSIAEVTGMEGETLCLQDLFRFRQTGLDQAGHATGHFEACGVRPQIFDRIVSEGVGLQQELFKQRVLTNAPYGNGAAHPAARR